MFLAFFSSYNSYPASGAELPVRIGKLNEDPDAMREERTEKSRLKFCLFIDRYR
jgi:hypothetical protein